MPRALHLRHQGFSMLEILVVMGIMALLFNYILSATMAAREQARRTVCVSNLKQLLVACKMYESDYSTLPVSYNANVYGTDAHWTNKTFPYIRNRQIYICPDDPFGGARGSGDSNEGSWSHSYLYLLNEFFLAADLSYRPPMTRSLLFWDGNHGVDHSTRQVLSGGIDIFGRYDGSIEIAPPLRYPTIQYQPEDGLGMLR